MVGKTYGEKFVELFDELKDYWENKESNFSPTSEETLVDLSLSHDSLSRICLFNIKREQNPFYKSYVFPIFTRYGFDPITYPDVIKPGENYLAKISSLVERSALLVMDLSLNSQWYLQEYHLAKNFDKQILIIQEENQKLPFEMNYTIITRPAELDPKKMDLFLDTLEYFVKQISPQITENLYIEPKRLLAKGENNAAIISVMTLLETQISKKLQEMDIPSFRMPFHKMLEYVRKYKLIPLEYEERLREMYMIRNKLVHRGGKITKKKAAEIVNDALKFSQKLDSDHF